MTAAAVTSNFEEDLGAMMDSGQGGGQAEVRRGNLRSQGSQTSGTQVRTMSGDRVRVTFVEDTEEKPAVRKPSYHHPPHQEYIGQKYNVKKKGESKFKAATRKLQRFLFKPFDYDANLS